MIGSLLNRRRPRTGAGRRLHASAVLATVAGAGLATVLTTGAASAQTAPMPPAPGVAPAITSMADGVFGAYTATNGSAWLFNPAGVATSAGGHLLGAPAIISAGQSLLLFGRGTDNQLWMTTCNQSGSCGSWSALGGDITAKPGAVAWGTNGENYSVDVRGTNGAVYARDHTASGSSAWYSLGGNLLAGTGPSDANLNGYSYVLATGTNHELYIAEATVAGFKPAGGRTNGSPALAAIPAAGSEPASLVGFAAGTNGAGYYHRFLSSTPGWQSMGGVLTSGLGAAQTTGANTDTVGLGSDNGIYYNHGYWGASTPSFDGWKLFG